jgi:hypothetical protein
MLLLSHPTRSLRWLPLVALLALGSLAVVGCAAGGKDRDDRADDEQSGDQQATVRGPKPTTSIPAVVNQPRIAVEDFYSLAGLSYGDGLAQVTAKFGKPVSTDDDPQYEFVTRYYGKSTTTEPLRITTWRANDRIYTITIEADTEPTPAKLGIKDQKLRLTTMSREEIMETLGRPKDPNASFLEYGWTDEKDRKIELTLWCGDVEGKICTSLEVFWFDTDEM